MDEFGEGDVCSCVLSLSASAMSQYHEGFVQVTMTVCLCMQRTFNQEEVHLVVKEVRSFPSSFSRW